MSGLASIGLTASKGCIYRQPDGSWWFIQAFAKGQFAFPFEHGPSNVSEAPAAGMLNHGEPAELAPRGTVIVERRGRGCYAGRISVTAPAQRLP